MNARTFGIILSIAVLTLCQTVSHAATRARFTGETVLNDSPVRISAADHTCQIKEDSSVRCWGRNDLGQLGFGGPHTATPTLVPGLAAGPIAVSAGFGTTCILLRNGQVECWGNNRDGQGGRPDPLSTEPAVVTGVTNAVAIAVGEFHTCALLGDGTVRCWGFNSDGQLGDNSQTSRPSPVAVQGLTNVIAITVGWRHT